MVSNALLSIVDKTVLQKTAIHAGHRACLTYIGSSRKLSVIAIVRTMLKSSIGAGFGGFENIVQIVFERIKSTSLIEAGSIQPSLGFIQPMDRLM